jgi:hypothetical protein
MTTAAPRRRRPLSSYVEIPPIKEVNAPEWFTRYPRWLTTTIIVGGLVLVSAVLRTRQLGGQLWFDEAGAVGIAQHSLGQIPGVVRANGGTPLYYWVLHIWTQIFGSSESATHALTVLCALATIPVAFWSGWTLSGRRAGLYAAVLFAFSAYVTHFAQETQPYPLLALLALIALTGFLVTFAQRRRWGLWPCAVALTLMLYTQLSSGLFAFGLFVAFGLLYRLAPAGERRDLLRDGAIAFGVPLVLFIPWIPNTIFQIAHATSPWQYTPLRGADVPADLMGGERVNVTLLVAVIVGFAPLASPARRRSREALTIYALIAGPIAGLLVARLASIVATTWVSRYFGPMAAALLVLGALGAARAKVVGVAAIVLCIGFLANPGSFTPTFKSDMRDVAGELGPMLHAGDLVVVGQPEQTPLAWYYLPGRVGFANTMGPVKDPTYMNWANAQSTLQDTNPQATLGRLVASLKPGQQLLFVRPLTEGVSNWKQPWTMLVRRRAAQWGQILTNDVASGTLKPVARAPHNYRGACCVANSATLYKKS